MTNARPVAKASAPPKPCSIRVTSRKWISGANVAIRHETQNTDIPIRKMRFLPRLSATLPAGTINMAFASIKAVGTQVTRTALALKSWAMAGTAIFTADMVTETQNVAMLILARANQRAEGLDS